MTEPIEESGGQEKICFVTTGATASFDGLVEAALKAEFINALADAGYTQMIIQYGKTKANHFEDLVKSAEKCQKDRGHARINIKGFDFNNEGLSQEMRAAKAEDGRKEGVVISHAGSGTILDALRFSVPIVVVPNPQLLDNHQVELAKELERQEYVVYGHLDNLREAIAESEKYRIRAKQWPPVNSGEHRRAGNFQGIIDEELGFLD